nr:hypothetical protein BaRGS_015346 [Batillaria attramentaria]
MMGGYWPHWWNNYYYWPQWNNWNYNWMWNYGRNYFPYYSREETDSDVQPSVSKRSADENPEQVSKMMGWFGSNWPSWWNSFSNYWSRWNGWNNYNWMWNSNFGGYFPYFSTEGDKNDAFNGNDKQHVVEKRSADDQERMMTYPE